MILDSPTAEETAKVRQYECRMNGHSYVDITAWGVDGPVAIKCSNCGKSWSVVQDEDGFETGTAWDILRGK